MHQILFTFDRCALFLVCYISFFICFCLFFRIQLFQARSIQDLAKRDFGNLRHEGEDGELQPKVVRRGRPPSKNTKKPLESSPVDCVGPELSSGATLASGEDKAIGSNSYNLRKAPPFYRFHSTDASLGNRSRNGESYSEWSIDWNQEFPGLDMYIMCGFFFLIKKNSFLRLFKCLIFL